jgi:hypothetical protein
MTTDTRLCQHCAGPLASCRLGCSVALARAEVARLAAALDQARADLAAERQRTWEAWSTLAMETDRIQWHASKCQRIVNESQRELAAEKAAHAATRAREDELRRLANLAIGSRAAVYRAQTERQEAEAQRWLTRSLDDLQAHLASGGRDGQ